MFGFQIFKKIFNFLASLKLAVIVILGLAYVLALGTIYESLYGTPVAKEKVYGTIWFSLILFFLGVNVLCAALSRLPWKKHHIGFVVTHAGIIVILIGSFITQKWGIDGSMALAEGEAGDRVVLGDSLLQVAIPDLAVVETWPAKFNEKNNDKSYVWKKELKDKSYLLVTRYYPHAEASLKVLAGKTDLNPALKVTLSNLPMEAAPLSEWIFEKESPIQSKKASMGPAQISFVSKKDLDNLQESSISPSTENKGKIELLLPEGKKTEFEVSKALNEIIEVEGTPYRVKGIQYIPDAVVRDNKLVTRSEKPNNPAFEFEILGPDLQESHLVFVRFPDLAAVHGKHQKSGIKAFYKMDEAISGMGKAELYLAIEGKGKSEEERGDEIFYRIRSKQGLTEARKAKVGEKYSTGWMGIEFQVEELIPKAHAEVQFRQVKLKKGMKEGPPPALQVKIEKDGKSEQAWMQQGDMKVLTLDGSPYVLRYGLRSYPLGFKVKLDKFQVLRYPGSESPSAFESFVTVNNEKTGAQFNAKIHMNEPLDYEGYTFYQSSYQEAPGQATISIFSIARDPGIPVKYAGSILLVGGIALMFWFKPLFVQKRIQAKKVVSI